MAEVQQSGECLNTIPIPLLDDWTVPLDLTKLKDYPRGRQYFNYCKVTNYSAKEIKIHIGADVKRVAGGDGFEWDRDMPVHFNSVIIDNLDTIDDIAVGDVAVEYSKVG